MKKGSVTVNVSKLTWSEDKKSVNVELAGKLTAGEYTVNVKGLTETALTKSVTVADEKVSKIEFGSEKDILAAGDNAGTPSATATVGYKVLNQYGEDITKTVSVSASTSLGTIAPADIDSSKGTIAIKNIEYPKSGDKVVLTLVHGGSATTATQTFAISDSSKVDSVTVDGLYNADKKELSEDTRTSNFYLKLNAKDQYNNALKATDLTGNVIITSSNPNVVAASAADIKEECL